MSRDLSNESFALLATHLATCEACREAASLLREDAISELSVLPPGTLVESYRIVREIGRGGTSIVFSAKHVAISRHVAIKVLDRRFVDSSENRSRFTRDAGIVAKLRSESSCRLLGFGELPSREPYMILELLDGEDLQTTVDERGRLDVPFAVDAILDACSALAEAHARGVIHRDIKPANLFVVRGADRRPLVKVLDFGVAKVTNEPILTRTGVTVGSVPYMAPEQLRSSRAVDRRVDIWGLGATLSHLISGRLPFRGSTPSDTAIRIWTEEPSLPDVPDTLSAILRRCMSKAAEDRYADVAELAAELAAFGGADAIEKARRVRRILETVQAN